MVYFDVEPSDERLNEAVTVARKGVELDEQDSLVRFMYGRALLAQKSYGDALAELESAVELNPNLAVVYCGLGDSLAYEGRFSEAIPHFEKAINLSPYDPQRWAFYSYRALAHLLARQFELAAEWAQKAARIPILTIGRLLIASQRLAFAATRSITSSAGRVAATPTGILLPPRAQTTLLHQRSRSSRHLYRRTSQGWRAGVSDLMSLFSEIEGADGTRRIVCSWPNADRRAAMIDVCLFGDCVAKVVLHWDQNSAGCRRGFRVKM